MGRGGMDVVGLGLATLDVLVRCEQPDDPAGEPALREFALEGGGPVATALCAASRLGARTGFVGIAGTDFGGEAKLLSLQRWGVDTSRVVRRPGAESSVILVRVDARSGERSFSGLGRHQQPLQPDELDRGYVTAARFLHLDGSHAEAALTAAKWMRQAGGIVVLDASATRASHVREGMAELVRAADVLISGSGFVQALTGEARTQDGCVAARAAGPRAVVQTEGADGSYTSCEEESFHTPAFPVDVVDTTGAGDVFHGAYIVGLMRGWPPRQVASFAAAVAALKCTKLGGRDGVVNFDQAVAFCRDRGVDL